MSKFQLFLSGLRDNAQHVNGIMIGRLILRPLGLRFDKSHRGQHTMFSNVAANMAANGDVFEWLPYRMLPRR
jgi:hypothetical protein